MTSIVNTHADDLTPGGDPLGPTDPTVPRPGRTRRTAWPTSLIIGTVLVGLILAVALTSYLWTPYEPSDTAERTRLGAPSAAHWFGTDKLGRDLLTQTMIGARLAVLVAFGAAALAGLIGITLGLLAATSRRIVDDVLSYVFDVLIALPGLLLAMLIVTVQGASTTSAIIAIGLSFSAVVARTVRISAARVMSTDYVRSAIACGTRTPGIITAHVLPNIYPILLVQLSLMASSAILVEASLSYLGLGTPPPTASWGRMLLEAQSSLSTTPWGALIPGIAILVTVMGLNFLGDGIREHLDPELADRD